MLDYSERFVIKICNQSFAEHSVPSFFFMTKLKLKFKVKFKF